MVIVITVMAELVAGCTPVAAGALRVHANDPAAERLYLRSLNHAISQSHFTLDTVTTSTGFGDTGGIVHGVIADHIRSVNGKRVSVVDRRAGGLPRPPWLIILANRTLCLRQGASGWSCAPTHPVSTAWYVRQYLLGGRVAHVSYAVTRSAHPSQSIAIHFTGRGILGCTPAGAGAGTPQGYRWCRFRDLDQVQQHDRITGELVMDAATLLPRRFTAQGVGTLSPVVERGTFRYGGTFTVTRPRHSHHLRCLSWVPAIHCIELRGKGHAVTT